MKYLLTLTLFLFHRSVFPAPPVKHALLVAISNYPAESGWRPIHCEKDVYYLTAALKRNGFEGNNIDLITDSSATRRNILAHIDALTAKCASGDIVFVHFSGHGQQIYDDNNDETDGYDEAYVPYDASSTYGVNGYKGENHLRDDDIEKRINVLQKTVGKTGEVIIVVDACHSGTISRGSNDNYRGTKEKFQPRSFVPKMRSSRDTSFFNRMGYDNVIAISACSADQLNYEMEDDSHAAVGSLSFSLSTALMQLSTSGKQQSTFSDLFESVRFLIQKNIPFQVPQIEGNLGRIVFSDKSLSEDVWFVSGWNRFDSICYIDRGLVHGITEGAQAAVFQHDLSGSKRDTVAYAILTEVGPTRSAVKLDRTLSKEVPYEVVLLTRSKPEAGDKSFASKLRSLNAGGDLLTKLKIDALISRQQFAGKERVSSDKLSSKTPVLLAEGDEVVFEITNKNALAVYITLIDVLPTDETTILLPDQGRTAEEYKIRPGGTLKTDPISISPPFGEEFFKLIFTLRPLYMDRSAGRGGESGLALEELFDIVAPKNRSGESKNGVAAHGIYSFRFEVSARTEK